ncbi:MAG: glycosyltransferase [Candidatus Aenigmarchaeota archaeon]|nr:glycosyltransferase [Candidatus Aenigmarchaeota archaeon]
MRQKFSIIVTSFGDDASILIKDVLRSKVRKDFILDKIVLVKCGPDKFNFQADSRITVIEEKERRGKAAAINKALSRIKSGLVVLCSADIVLRKNALAALLQPFENPGVGMSSSRPVSMDDTKTYCGFLNFLVWEMHHIISEKRPKGGEMIAFRKVFDKIPENIAADEAFIESEIIKRGYRIQYAPFSMVMSSGPAHLSGFVMQRRRVFSGHLQVRKLNNYSVSTMDNLLLLKSLARCAAVRKFGLKQAAWSVSAILVEMFSRFLGLMDYKSNKVLFMWPKYRRGNSK